MGDRGNIQFVGFYGESADPQPAQSERLSLYAHWHGYELPKLLQAALSSDTARRSAALSSDTARRRWSDSHYLTRIITSNILHSQIACNEETGWGLGIGLADNEYPVIVVDVSEQRVRIERVDGGYQFDAASGASWTFEEYCALADVSWEALSLAAATP